MPTYIDDDTVLHTAEWRRYKAEEFPDDSRNLEAAEELERIASEIKELANDSSIIKQIEAAEKIIETYGVDGGDICMAVSDELRSVGFHTSHTGVSLLEWYRDLLQEKAEKCLDEALPAPDLAEQVENDPAVKMAKQVYEEAKAKAYAEARKKL